MVYNNNKKEKKKKNPDMTSLLLGCQDLHLTILVGGVPEASKTVQHALADALTRER